MLRGKYFTSSSMFASRLFWVGLFFFSDLYTLKIDMQGNAFFGGEAGGGAGNSPINHHILHW